MIKAGTGMAALDLTPVLPIEGFNVIQNDLHVRTIILDGKKRMVIVSVEVTSLQEDSVVRFLGKIKEMTGADDDCIWMTFTHSFAGPHVFLPPKPGQENLYTYISNNKDNIDYPAYREKGYFVGSGAIESGNKTVLQSRLKLPGMRWNVPTAQCMVSLKAKLESQRWEKDVIPLVMEKMNTCL